jgi:hypothetical protein
MNRRLDLEAVAAERHERTSGWYLAGLKPPKLGIVHAPIDGIDDNPGPVHGSALGLTGGLGFGLS